ncbi:MAG: cell division protein DedD [Rickettsiales bacterium]|nr:cell division protein DedD [Rickettsiales bacterium]|tara:strand:+ start:243 stop:524 length:282 start_codon:yes stop_codon:yes gene_type:complete
MKNLDRNLLADVAEKLISHLMERKDVQNIDLMNLSGFCRNCLSKWYVEAAQNKNINISYEEARELIYGMPYEKWKQKYQKEATKEQLEKRKKI